MNTQANTIITFQAPTLTLNPETKSNDLKEYTCVVKIGWNVTTMYLNYILSKHAALRHSGLLHQGQGSWSARNKSPQVFLSASNIGILF